MIWEIFVRLLEYENRLLKDKLKKENIPYDEVNPFEETIDNVEENNYEELPCGCEHL